MNNYKLYPVGEIIRHEADQAVMIYKDYKSALLNIEKFSHIIIFWINSKPEEINSLFKKSKNVHQALNVLDTFCFNRIELCITGIKNYYKENGIITIYDSIIPQHAIIVDIKPYFPMEDRVKDCIIPDFLSSLPDFIPEEKSEEIQKIINSKWFTVTEKRNKNILIDQCGKIIKKSGSCRIELPDADDEFFNKYEAFSHIQILWWFNRFEKDNFRKTTQCNPPYEKAPRTGVFASRSPVRPNPVGLTTARILKIDRKRRVMEISQVDAFNNTPVIDIKPYIPFFSLVKEAKIPPWIDHWGQWLEDSELLSPGSPDLTDSDFIKLSLLYDLQEDTNKKEGPMEKEKPAEKESDGFIIVIGARENNLKNIDIKIPKNKMTVITGLSGSGKSTLAFDTIYAESQRRFMDSISSTGRQFFKQFERPQVDQVLNLPPAIAVEQKAISRNTRSTVGTISDINDYLRLLYARIGVRHCPKCGRAVEVKTSSDIINLLGNLPKGISFDIVSIKNNKLKSTFIVPEKSRNNQYTEELEKIVREMLDKESGAFKVAITDGDEFILHTRNHCYYCGVSFFELTPSFFSSNNPESMCPDCDGLGTQMNISPDLIVASPEKSILDSASAWWGDLRKFLNKPTGNWMKGEVIALARSMKVDMEKPWKDLPPDFRQKALFGTDGELVNLTYYGSRGRSGDISRSVEGAVNQIKRLFRGSHGKNSNDFYLQFMDEKECPTCMGEQLSPDARFVTIADKRFPEVSSMSIDALHEWIKKLPERLPEEQLQISKEIIYNIINKTKALIDVGLHYLSLKRPLPTLSGGEAQRLRLSTQLGCGLTNLLYILDEPSVGLHQSDHSRLIETMKQLRDTGNTLIVVEHDKNTMLEADYLIDMGPGAGINGGRIVAQGTPNELMGNKDSVTGKYLINDPVSGYTLNTKQRKPKGRIALYGANKNNLKNINASFPLGMFICITGKSGSGKSSLISHTLSPVLTYYCNHGMLLKGDYEKIEGIELVDNVISITQEAIGRSPRSNPATYTGVFDEIRNIFASTDQARSKNYSSNRFSFNSKEGRCESCEGEGRKKIEMNFMPDVWITCPDCRGKRFNKETLLIKYKDKTIADVLETDINEAAEFFSGNEKISRILTTLQDVGLGYIKPGQSALTLSGGEAQRVKLAKELSKSDTGSTLYILDEPTTGLHFADIEHLLTLLHRIVDAGNTVVVIEHNIDLIKKADWIIDLGPEGGEKGGYIIFEGTPEELRNNKESYTGNFIDKLA